MKINKIIALLLAAVTVFALAACNKKGQMYSEKNAYASIYVTGEGGKKLYTVDDLRVAPLDEEEIVEETVESGLLTEKSARDRYRTIPTPMLALELCITNKERNEKDKEAALPVLNISQLSDGTIKYDIESVKGIKAGKKDNSNDIFEWKCEVFNYETQTTEVVDPFTYKLNHKYDIVYFKFSEVTYRTFTATFELSDGPDIILPEKKFNVEGEKTEMNISNYLKSNYLDEKTNKPAGTVMSSLGITLSEDGKRVIKAGNLENSDTHHWICYIDDIENGTIADLTAEMISERDTIHFDYVEIEEEAETGENEDDEEEEIEEE